MAFPRVKTFCCVCSLKSGTLIIGWLQIVWAIVNCTTALMETTEYSKEVDAILNILQLALGVVLIYGTKKRLSAYIYAYVISGIIANSVAAILVVPSVFFFLMEDLIIGGIVLIMLSVIFIAYWYVLMVISSFRKEMLDEIKLKEKEE